jgi:GNAT superfamily N-acetyltransferase
MPETEPEIQLVPADRVALSQRVAIMNAAYADYYVPTRVTQEQMASLDRFYDVDVARSMVAHTRWECIGMALLALRGPRAWVSGVGVVPAWRRRGVARTMMRRLIAAAAEAGARTMLLEVIVENEPARRLYAALGFETVRELLTWQRPTSADPLPIPLERLVPASPLELLANSEGWRDQRPCWQRETATLRSMAGRLTGYRLDWRGEPTAYCLINTQDETVSLADVGINPDAGLLMPGRLLLQALAASYYGRPLSIMNVPADDALNRVLAALGFLVTVRQVEMALNLDAAPWRGCST